MSRYGEVVFDKSAIVVQGTYKINYRVLGKQES